MNNEMDFNNCSEDIFRSCSESSEINLRRSQRVLERSQKTPTVNVCFENFLMKDTTQSSTEPLAPKQLLEVTSQNSTIKTEHANEENTPDFSYMLNTEATQCSSNQLEASKKQASIKENAVLEGSNEECSTDLKAVSKQCTNSKKKCTKQKRKVSAARTCRKRCTSKNSQKVYSENIEPPKNVEKIPKDLESISLDKGNKNTVSQLIEKASKTPCKSKNSQQRGSSKKVFQTLTPDQAQQTMGEANVPINENKLAKKRKRCATKQAVQELEKPTSNACTRKRQGRPMLLSSNMKKQALDQPTINDYVPPKVIRYYNSCPTMQSLCGFPSGQSLLPAVYPPHFSQQKIMAPTIPQALNMPLPISCLTPENSQVLQQPHIEEQTSSSTPLSVGSLQEFFEVDDLCEILNAEKTIYHLTELHVRALALTLNLNVEEFFSIMDKIVDLEPNILREKCTAYQMNISKSTYQNEV